MTHTSEHPPAEHRGVQNHETIVTHPYGDHLFDHHAALLAASAISPDVAAARGYVSIDQVTTLHNLHFSKQVGVPGLLIPVRNVLGEIALYEYRPDRPRLDQRGRERKYEKPVGAANTIDVPLPIRHLLGDPSVPLWVTEGARKADAAVSAGLVCVSLPGVWGWRGTNSNGGKTALPDWEHIALKGREVNICFDSDVMTKPSVAQALERFTQFLEHRGAKVRHVILPGGEGKTGLDDFLANGGTVADLEALRRRPALSTQDTIKPPTQDGGTPLTDAHLAQTVADVILVGRYVWADGLGWLRWDGRRWERTPRQDVIEQVRQWAIGRLADANSKVAQAMAAGDHTKAKQLQGLVKEWMKICGRSRIEAITALAQGVVMVSADQFDRHHHLLNTANGVVDLRTGDLLPHSPHLWLTKITETPYRPDAQHRDWTAALACLPADVLDWMQIRFGQAATGYMPDDDMLVICQGSGRNGKSTLFTGLHKALGDYSVLVSERVLMANPDAHPTEMMDLRGARMALIEETPEERRLDVQRLKKVVGTPRIKARYIRENTVEFEATHSLFITTNHRPQVNQTDYGTWRRLALVQFPYTFTGAANDHGLRARIQYDPDVHAAALAWIVEGAKRWFAAGQITPPPPQTVAQDTAEWRASADTILAFWQDHLVPDPTAHIMATELFTEFSRYLQEKGLPVWSERTFVERFAEHEVVTRHGVQKVRGRSQAGLSRPGVYQSTDRLMPQRPLPQVYIRWVGVRWRTASDDEADMAAEQ